MLFASDEPAKSKSDRPLRDAHHFSLRRMPEVRSVTTAVSSGCSRLAVQALSVLRPDVDRGLDVSFQGILDGYPFLGEYDGRPGASCGQR
jgi:hypothetical protein